MQDTPNKGEKRKVKKKITTISQIKTLHAMSVSKVKSENYTFHFRSPPITLLNHTLNHDKHENTIVPYHVENSS